MKILLGVDDSKFSKAAIHAVMRQARPKNDEVRVVHVVDILTIPIPNGLAYYPGIEHAQDAQREVAEKLVHNAARLLRSEHLQVATEIKWGHPKSIIIDTAAEWHADLIVLGSHGRTGLDRFLMGSVADAVMRHAHCSVELVRILPGIEYAEDSGREGKFTRILLAIDDSRFSQTAVRMLSEQLHDAGTEVRVLSVVEPPNLLVTREISGYDEPLERAWEIRTREAEDLVAKVAERFCGRGAGVTTHIAQGEPKTRILEEAQEWRADLIVIGSHGRTGLARFLLGSVSEAVARHARCSVEVVRSTDREKLAVS